MSLLTIRTAKKSEVGLLSNLGWQTFFDTFQQDNTKEDMELFLQANFNKQVQSKEFNDPLNTFLLAFLAREAVGYVKLSESGTRPEFDGAESLEISRIYAVKQKIGSGIGSALMKKSIQLAVQRSKKMLWLGVWEKNQRAIAFYRRFGFEKFGEHHFLLGNDRQNDWLMKKDLTNSTVSPA